MIKIITTFLGLLIMGFSQTELWVYRYNGPGNSADEGNQIIFGQDGNIYTVGNSTGSGTWYDFTVISIDDQGNERWIYRYDGPASYYDYGSSIVFGVDDNIYASGNRSRFMGFYEAIIVNLDTLGNEKWLCVDSALLHIDQIVFGQDGNIYGIGYSNNAGTGDDLAVVSHDEQGNMRWLYEYYGSYSDWGRSIAYGSDGNVYASGTHYLDGFSNSDCLIIGIDSLGNEKWVYTYNGTGNELDDAQSIIYGQDGNVYAAGFCEDTGTGLQWDFLVISLDTLGNERWLYKYNGPGDYVDVGRAIVYGQDGNLYTAGYSDGSGTSDDLVVISLDTQGSERWVYRYDGPNNSMDAADAVVYGADNNIYVTGFSTGVGSNYDFVVIGLDTLGNERWVYRYNGPGNHRDEANSITYGQDGNVYAAGFSSNSSTYEDWDFTVISLDPNIGIEEKKVEKVDRKERLIISPNPAKNHISFNRHFKGHIYNVLGQKVMKVEGTTADLKNLSAGTYIIVDNESKIRGNIIKYK